METKHINGFDLEQMLKSGLNNLKLREKEVNEMNVFPVPDGDTGTNMRLTLENGIKNSPSNKDLGAYLKRVAEGMLFGARGNSGVILSQLFNGMSLNLVRDGIVNVKEMCEALVSGYKAAYSAVARPVEGTILTVAREGIENIYYHAIRCITFENMLSIYLAELRKSLSFTPEILPELKSAGVVDSGAMGYIYVVEGMVKCLFGEDVFSLQEAESEIAASEDIVENSEAFNANSEFKYGYCMEFLLQLMNGSRYLKNFKLEDYRQNLTAFGNSIVAVQSGDRVKVHIHTFQPDSIMRISQAYGEFINFKLENMQLQHNESIKEERIKKPFSIITVCNGGGAAKFFKDMGADIVIEGGPTMNVPAAEFVRAFSRLESENIVVFPNNKNVFGAVEQAVKISGKSGVTMLQTKSITDAYYALAMDDAGSDAEYRISSMKSGLQGATTLSIAISTKDYSSGEVSCKKGDYIALINGDLVYASTSLKETVTEGLNRVEDISYKETCIIFKGKGATDETDSEVTSAFEENFSEIEKAEVESGQEVLLYVIGL